jgi:hypothetical protein
MASRGVRRMLKSYLSMHLENLDRPDLREQLINVIHPQSYVINSMKKWSNSTG